MIFAAICFLCASGASWAQSDAVTVTLSSGNPGATIPSDFSGLSFEEADLLPVSGKYYFVNTNQPLITLFNTLGVTSLRIGGNTADSGTLPANADIDALFGFAEAAGVKVLYTLRLKTFNAAAENTVATYIMDHYSADMACFEIGNEPDIYTSYATYQSEAQTYINTISASNPTAMFCGTNDTGGAGSWNVSFAQYFASTGKIAHVGHHDYFGGAGGSTTGAAARDKLLAATMLSNYATNANVFVPTVLSEGLSYRMSETNSYYNGGSSGCSNTFAEALWDLDYMFWWAGEKAEGLNFHTGDTVSGGTAWYSFFTTTTGGYTVHPGAYGPLAFKLGGHGRIVPVTLSNPSGMDLTAYGVLASDNSLWVTIINKTHETGSITADLTIDLGGSYSNGDMWLMQAPNNDDSQMTGITLGGGGVGVNGTWSGTSEPVSVSGNTATVILSPASAAVIQFVPGTGGSCTAAPSAPTGLAASGTTSTGTTLNWTADTAPANCTITSYTVLKNGASIGTATSTPFAVTGLSASTEYSFTVEATDSVGTSPASSALDVTTTTSTEGPYPGPAAAAVPGTVMAENYDTGGQGVGYNVTSTNGTANTYRSQGVDLEAATAPATGDNIGWTAAGQWFRYTVNVATAGTYKVSFLVSAESAIADGFHLSNSAGTNLSGSVAVPDTGAWQTWATVTANVTLPAGKQTLTLSEDAAGWNIDSMIFASSGASCAAVPSAPTGLAASGTTSTGTALNWTADTAPANCSITSYTVLKNGASIGTATGTTFAVTGLSASTEYSFTVEATDSVGTSAASSAVSVTTTSGGGGATLATGTPYNIVNENSGSCIMTNASGTANGTTVVQYACAGGTDSTETSQQWEFTNGTATGYYKVTNVNAPTEAWNVAGDATASGSLVQTWTYNGYSNEEWEAVSQGNGYYEFVGQGSGLCLAVPGSSTANSVQLEILACNGSTAEAFKLVTP